MAKNFASVLEALKKAGLDKQSDVEKSYTASRGWILEQFKAAQASFSDLTAEGYKQTEDQARQVCLIATCSSSRCADSSFSEEYPFLLPQHDISTWNTPCTVSICADEIFYCCASCRAQPSRQTGSKPASSAICLLNLHSILSTTKVHTSLLSICMVHAYTTELV